MQTTPAVILGELARWEEAQKDVDAILATAALTRANPGSLPRVQEIIAQEIAKLKAALAEYPNVN